MSLDICCQTLSAQVVAAARCKFDEYDKVIVMRCFAFSALTVKYRTESKDFFDDVHLVYWLQS